MKLTNINFTYAGRTYKIQIMKQLHEPYGPVILIIALNESGQQVRTIESKRFVIAMPIVTVTGYSESKALDCLPRVLQFRRTIDERKGP